MIVSCNEPNVPLITQVEMSAGNQTVLIQETVMQALGLFYL